MPRPARARVAAFVALAFFVVGCRRAKTEASPAPEKPIPPPSAPSGLLFEGALGDPATTWRGLRTLLGGHALAVPMTYPLAVTTVLGASPLSAGLVDENAPVALAVLDVGGSVGPVFGVRVSSGKELVAALATGGDARFTSEAHPDEGVTFLTPKGAITALAVAVAADTLVIAQRLDVVAASAAWVGRTLAPSLRETHAFTLVAKKAALSGPVAAAVGERLRGFVETLTRADTVSRAAHGRAPDFGDPRVVIDAISGLGDSAARVLASSSEMRFTAKILGEDPSVRIELVPDPVGAATELVRGLDVGDSAPVLSLPAATDAAIGFRSEPGAGGGSIASRLLSVLGDRLDAPARARVEAFSSELRQAFGPFAVAFVSSGQGGPSLCVLGPSGDSSALTKATADLPPLLRVPALVRPVLGDKGSVSATPRGAKVDGASHASTLAVRITSPSSADPGGFELTTASVGERVVATVARIDSAALAESVLVPRDGATLAGDSVVSRAVAHAGTSAALFTLSRFHDESGHAGFAALAAGSDRRVAWAELTLSEVSERALISMLLAPSLTSPATP